jgi:hypothetical protein
VRSRSVETAGDRGQRLAAEAEARDPREVLERRELARRVALEREAARRRGSCRCRRRSPRSSARPPSRSSTRKRVACASSAFSISSFTTEAGRSTTSPAAIWSISALGSRWTEPRAARNPPPAISHPTSLAALTRPGHAVNPVAAAMARPAQFRLTSTLNSQ